MKNSNLIKDWTIEGHYTIGRFNIITIRLGKIVAVGISRKGRGEKYNKKIAYDMALGRAKRALIKKINKEPLNNWYEG